MITDFEDFCTWAYVVAGDVWQQIAPLFKRSGPSPKYGDSELIAMVLTGETVGCDVETEMLNHWKEHEEMFPNFPSQSRFNRRRH